MEVFFRGHPPEGLGGKSWIEGVMPERKGPERFLLIN